MRVRYNETDWCRSEEEVEDMKVCLVCQGLPRKREDGDYICFNCGTYYEVLEGGEK